MSARRDRGGGRRAARAAAVLAITGALAGPGSSAASPTAKETELMRRYRPVLRFDSAERRLPTGIESLLGVPGESGRRPTRTVRLVNRAGEVLAATDPSLGRPRLDPDFLGARYPGPAGRAGAADRIVWEGPALESRAARPLVYGRVAIGPSGSAWLQYWLFYLDNPQDRGVLRTGRHQGDWELIQVRLDRSRRPRQATFRAHTWAHRCAWNDVVRSRTGAPVAFVANGSHANYPRSGIADRPWPDPNDEADGRGRSLRPRLRPITATSPRWVRWPGRYGGSAASSVPGEQSSPRGPAFQAAWSDPAALDREARGCRTKPPGRPWQTAATVAFPVVAALAIGFAARRRRRLDRP